MNIGGSNNVICVNSGVTFTAGFTSQSVTINVYGTLNLNGSLNSNVTLNVYNGGKLYAGSNANLNSTSTVNVQNGGLYKGSNVSGGTITIASGGTFEHTGNTISGGTFNNSGTILLSSTNQVNIQNSGTTINNNAGAVFNATAPSKVLFNSNTVFTNSGTATFKNVENQEGIFTNNATGSVVFDQGTFQHGTLQNYGSITVNCAGTNNNSSCSQACMTLGNKGPGQTFANNGTLTVHGSLCLDAQVIFHNNGTTIIDGNLNVSGGGQWNQGTNGTTTIGGTTTTSGGGQFNGGTYCSNGTSGTINSTASCGSAPTHPPTTSDLTASTCKNVFVNIPIAASVDSGSTIAWDSLRIINGTDTIRARATTPTLTVASVGNFQISYTGSSATVKFTPLAVYTGTTTIKYTIASRSGTSVTYSAVKNITVTVKAPPSKPTASIAIP